MFEKVRLITEKGEKVAEVTIPEFWEKPRVLQWGPRFFVLDADGPEDEPKIASIYCEAFSYFVEPIPGIDNNGYTVDQMGHTTEDE